MAKLDIVDLQVTLAFKKIQEDSFYSRVIGKWTKSNYSHVEIIINKDWISSVEGKGVHIKPLKPKKDEYDYLDLGTVSVTSEQHSTLYTWLYRQNNKKYDTTGILFSQILPLRLDNRDKWFCSELVTKILQILMFKEVVDFYPHLTSPGDLAKVFKIEF